MCYRYLLFFIAGFLLFSCKKETGTLKQPPPFIDSLPVILLKEIVIPKLPSPYYHFEYNTTGRASGVSFASGFTNYQVLYDGGRISEMRNNIIVNKDRLQYIYDNEGHVSDIRYADSTGAVFIRAYFTYAQQKLVKIEWEKKSGTGFILYKTITMSYHADGNLKDLTLHRPAMSGQPETTYTDHYEQYDAGVNVDGFSLIHTEFFEHLVLLPGLRLQKNNPGKQTRTGDGSNFKIDYSYTYTSKNLPLTKSGDMLFSSGADAGKRFQTNSFFSYYE